MSFIARIIPTVNGAGISLDGRAEAHHSAPPTTFTHPMIGELRAAAGRFKLREAAEPGNDFIRGKAATCLDIAAKLERFGSFASDAQAGFAAKLVAWAQPRQPQQGPQTAPGGSIAPAVVPHPLPAPAARLERLFDLMQRLAKLTIGELQIIRKNGDSLCWVKHSAWEGVIGRIEGGKLSLFGARIVAAGQDLGAIKAALLAIEADPEAAAVLHGKASGRCAVCSRDLTDPESIERGIGPICAEKF